MKIALVSTYDIAVPSGVNGHIAHLAHEFRGRGHEVKVIAPGPPGEREPGTITMGRSYPFPSGGSLARVTISPWLGLHVKRLLGRERFDLIHIHEPLVSALTLLTLYYARAVTVGTFHAARERGTSRGYAVAQPVLRRFAAKLDGRIAVSPAAARLASRYFPGDYEIIPNGVDAGRFATALPCPPSLAERRPYVLFLGRFEDRKGLPVLLEAFRALRARRPELTLVVAGDGRRRERYEREVARLGLDGVLFAGRVPGSELPAYYQHAAVYCAPNTGNESFGIVLLEAMAAGCPVVASRIEGFAAVVRDEVDGLLVPPHDPAALAAALDRTIGDRALTASLMARGRCRAQEFDWPRIAERVLGYYARLLDERRERATG